MLQKPRNGHDLCSFTQRSCTHRPIVFQRYWGMAVFPKIPQPGSPPLSSTKNLFTLPGDERFNRGRRDWNKNWICIPSKVSKRSAKKQIKLVCIIFLQARVNPNSEIQHPCYHLKFPRKTSHSRHRLLSLRNRRGAYSGHWLPFWSFLYLCVAVCAMVNVLWKPLNCFLLNNS